MLHYPTASLFYRAGAKPWIALIWGVCASFVLCILGAFIGLATANALLGIDTVAALAGTEALSPAGAQGILLMQACFQVIGMGLAALLLGHLAGNAKDELGLQAPPQPRWLGLAFALTIISLPMLERLTFTPEQFVLPESMKGLEQWVESTEGDLSERLMQLIPHNLLIDLLVIALVPAVTEELLFRGWLQRTLQRVMPTHWAIWIQGILFSAIHLQFLGFPARMAMGVLFGYLRHWSGSVWPSVLAHFVNNGLAITVLYLSQKGKLPAGLASSTDGMPGVVAFASAIMTGFLLWRIQQYKETPSPIPTSTPHA